MQGIDGEREHVSFPAYKIVAVGEVCNESGGHVSVDKLFSDLVLASSPGLPRLFVAASDVKAVRPGRFWYIRLHWVYTNVTSCQPSIMLPSTRLSRYCTGQLA